MDYPERDRELEGRGTKILYVEDDFAQAKLFQRRLEREGYSVELAFDGREGLKLALEKNYQIVATDHDLPGEDGLHLIETLRQKHPDPPIILMITGAGNEKIAVEAIKRGASDYIVKDSGGRYLELLPTVISNLLRQKKTEEEKRAAQKALEENERKFRAMFENAPLGMASYRPDGQVIEMNRVFKKILRLEGTPPPELFFSLLQIPPDTPPKKVLELFSKEGLFGPQELEFKFPSGDKTYLQVRAVCYRDTELQHQIWLFVEDVYEHRELQRRLMQSSKLEAIGELAASIAHEMNNPLGIISAKARLLLSRERGNMSPKVISELEKIIAQSDRLHRLARGLLNYSRPTVSRREPVEIHLPLQNAIEMIEHRAKNYNIEVQKEFSNQNLIAKANSAELEQVFLNLLFNAIEAMPNGGKITISTRLIEPHRQAEPPSSPPLEIPQQPKESDEKEVRSERWIQIVIADTGEGIPPEIQNKIFEPFFTTKEKGTGLGLSICFGLLRSNEGSISVRSEPGRGAEFTIHLPLYQNSSS